MQFIAEVTGIRVKPPKAPDSSLEVVMTLKCTDDDFDFVEFAYLSRTPLVFEVRAIQEKLPWDTKSVGPEVEQ